MSSDLENVKEGVVIVGELIKIAGSDPNVKKAAQNMGQAALTITKTVNNALLPLAAVNFAFDKARDYFASRFEADLAAQANDIPAESIVEPKASIAGPALQGLAFAHEEDSLREMFVSLIASSMDMRRAKDVHPAFSEVVRQLSAVEAVLFRDMVRAKRMHAIAQLKKVDKGTHDFVVLNKHVLDAVDPKTNAPIEIEEHVAMIENWIRLGLFEVDYDNFFTEESRYAWLETRPEYIRAQSENIDIAKILEWDRGVLRITAFGKRFSAIVGVLDNNLAG